METHNQQALDSKPQKEEENLSPCRMYESKLPDIDDLVMGRVVKMDSDIYATVALPEYNNIEGIIMYSEVTKVRIRSMKNHLQLGKLDVMQVLKVDKEKGYLKREP